MAEDLDQLLDEVEDRFCRLSKRDCPDGFRTQGEKNNNPSEAPETAKAASSVKRAWISKNSTKHDNEEEDLDEIINDIISENNFAKNHVKCISKSSSLTAETNVTSSHAHDKRCCPVYLGGSTAPCGIGTNISQKYVFGIYSIRDHCCVHTVSVLINTQNISSQRMEQSGITCLNSAS
ncbi:cilia- and flagella-associated protein 418 isoform X2 [Sphaerodactylus townsendi]|uniref:cilia- and flagella-associated protein 418 isoform X2 n=1 Tax=Sphaerodactylus townsendi TaxID=933632 RepID=UPI002026CB7D|nr:cilia- and flagella-associated protein 418 isoform X2 [Sphaerodactylus townsendi]